MTPDWVTVVRDALLEERIEDAEYIAKYFGIQRRFRAGIDNNDRRNGYGILVDVRPYLARDGRWYMSIYILVDGTENYPHLFTSPNGNKCSFIGELQHISMI